MHKTLLLQTVLVAAAGLFVADIIDPKPAAAFEPADAKVLGEYCRATSGFHRTSCLAYIAGVIDGYNSLMFSHPDLRGRKICLLTRGRTEDERREILVKHIDALPTLPRLDPADTVIDALCG